MKPWAASNFAKMGNHMEKQRIGFIGAGLMGHGMAKNLVGKGFPLTVLAHRNRAPVEDLIERGASEAATPKEIAQKSDIVFLCVTSSAQVEAIIEGPDGLIAGGGPGLIICDCSTADPFSTIRLGETLARHGIAYADAPLGGTPTAAESGELSAMVGADAATFDKLKPTIAAWAAKIVHIGPLGTGHKMKLLNNFLSMGYGAIYAEALTLAAKIGLTPRDFDSVIRGGRMDCGFYQTYMGWVIDRNPNAHQFTLANAYKDMRYVVSMGDQAGISNPVASAIKASYALAVSTGAGERYVPMLTDEIGKLAGLSKPET